jgi:signal transduction histidine kinase
MSASAASVAHSSPSRSAPPRDPPRLQILSVILTLVLAALLIGNGGSLVATFSAEWKSLLFWAVLITLVSIFPIRVDDALLTVDEPILLALALLYPPEVAALVALFASIDVREFKGQIVFARALYNRAQVGLSVYLAGAAFRSVTGGAFDPWPIAVMGTGAAVAAEYLANVTLVSLHARVRWGLDLPGAVRKLKVGSRGEFLATYLGYGSLALILVHLFRLVGAWSAAAFLVPILVARQMLIRGQTIETLSEEVRDRDQLLKNVSDRILDERRDERHRVASDLHDGILQDLTKIWLLSSLLAKSNQAGSPSKDVEKLVTISEASTESLRSTIRNLREALLGENSLIPTLDAFVRDARLEWKTKINLELTASLPMTAESQVVVYQVAREAILNALKHAQASKIWVRLFQETDQLVLEVEDDGIGFQPERVDPFAHFGLALIEERTRKLDGNVSITSLPNRGTAVRACFPLRTRNPRR